MSDNKRLEEIIGYDFKDKELLTHALTHSSFSNENRTGRLGSNERLEFLGDAVLELVSSEYFFKRFKNLPEGELTKMRASFVCEPALDKCARKLKLDEFILLGKGEDSSGGRKRPSVVSDAFEALIGAIYIDGGFEKAREVIYKYILDDVDNESFFYDSKTVLQEEAQRLGNEEPEYVLLAEEGPDHLKEFTIEVRLNGETMGVGKATSKKHAAQNAAYEALKKMGKV